MNIFLDDYQNEVGCDVLTMSDFNLHHLLMRDENIKAKQQNGEVHYFSMSPQQEHIVELVARQKPRKRKEDRSPQMNSTSFMSTTANSTFSVGTFKRPLPMTSLRIKKKSTNLRRRSSVSSINSSFNSSASNDSAHKKHSMTLNSSIVSYAADKFNEFDKNNVSEKL